MGGMRSKSNATIWMRASLFKPQLGLNSHYRERRTRFEQKQEKMHKAYITMLIKNIYILFRKIFFFKPKEDFPVHKKGLFCSREIMCWERVAAFPTMETSLLERVVQRRVAWWTVSPSLAAMPYLSAAAQEVAFEPECDELQESRLQGEGAWLRNREGFYQVARHYTRCTFIAPLPALQPSCLIYNQR